MQFVRFRDRLPTTGRPLLVLHCEPDEPPGAVALCVGQIAQMRPLPLGGAILCNMLGDQFSTHESALVALYGCWAYLSDVASAALSDCPFNLSLGGPAFDLEFEGAFEHVISGQTGRTISDPPAAA